MVLCVRQVAECMKRELALGLFFGQVLNDNFRQTTKRSQNIPNKLHNVVSHTSNNNEEN